MTDEQLLADAKSAFALCEEAEAENRIAALDDLRFANPNNMAQIQSLLSQVPRNK